MSYFYRQAIIDETGDHYLVVDPTEKAMSKVERLKLREQHKITSHFMQGKGKYYGSSPAVNPIIDIVF